MKKIKENINSIILCVFEALVGILLLIDPIAFTMGIIIAAGAALLLVGIISGVKYFRTDAVEAAMGQILLKGLITLCLGLFCIFKYEWFVFTFPLLTILYGIVTLIAGLWKIQLSADMFRLKKGKWYFALISALVSVACAAVILANPFASTAVLWAFTGVSLIVEAIFDIITLIVGQKKNKSENA